MAEGAERARLLNHFEDLEDPRIERCKRHSLPDIIAIAICAVICGAMFGRSRRETGLKVGIRGKRLQVCWKEDCLLEVLLSQSAIVLPGMSAAPFIPVRGYVTIQRLRARLLSLDTVSVREGKGTA